MGTERQRTDAENILAAYDPVANEDPLTIVNRLQETSVKVVEFAVAETRVHQPESHQRQLRVRNNLDALDPAKLLGGPLGKVEFFVELTTERSGTVHLER